MENFGAEEPGEASGSKPLKKAKRKQIPNESTTQIELEASIEPSCQSKQKQMQCRDESKLQSGASPNEPEKRGRRARLTATQKRANRLKSLQKYRDNKAAKEKELQEKNQELENENRRLKEGYKQLEEEKEGQQSEINSLKQELSENNAKADKLKREVRELMEAAKMVTEVNETGVQQLEQMLLNQDHQDPNVVNSELNNAPFSFDGVGIDDDLGNLDFSSYPDPPWSMIFAEQTVNINGFNIGKENSPIMEEIFREYPNIVSGMQVRYPALRDGFMNTLAEVYKKSSREVEKLNEEEIKHMEDGLEDLEFAGLDIPWLKDLVAKAREEVQDKEEIETSKAAIENSKAALKVKEAELIAKEEKIKERQLKRQKTFLFTN